MTSHGGPLAVTAARRVIAETREALAALTAALTACPTAELGTVAAEVAQLRLSAENALVEVTREAVDRGCLYDKGATSAGVWLGRETVDRVEERDARTIGAVATAVLCPTYAPVREALAAGAFGATVAKTVLDQHHEMQASLPWAMHDDMLTRFVAVAAEGYSVAELRKLRRMIVAEYGAEGLLDKQQATLARKRAMSVFTEEEDGMFSARLRLDPASHAVVAAALDAFAAPKTGTDERGEVVLDDRSPDQRRADAVVELCANAPGLTGTGMRHTAKAKVVVTMAYDDLVHGTGCGTTPTGEILAPSVVREMACDAEIIPLVLGGPGSGLDVGRDERLATPSQVTALRHRDKGCTFPGCSRPPTWCRAHHIRHWSRGGPTDLANLALLCQHHHTFVHRHDLTATVDTAGVHWHIPAYARGHHAA